MIYTSALCIILVVVGVRGQIDEAAFKNSKFTLAVDATHKLTVTANDFRADVKLIAYHLSVCKGIVVPNVGDFNSGDITTKPYKWEVTDNKLVKGAAVKYWVRMETTDGKGHNSDIRSATL